MQARVGVARLRAVLCARAMPCAGAGVRVCVRACEIVCVRASLKFSQSPTSRMLAYLLLRAYLLTYLELLNAF